jgi:nitrate reductase NapAB chaperone NapD
LTDNFAQETSDDSFWHYCGIILLRLKDWRRQNILKRLQEALSQLKGRSLQGKLVIVGEAKVRVR